MRGILGSLFVTAALLFSLTASTSAATYYVAVDGDDAASGAQGSPWRTLGHSLPELAPGDTLMVGGGEYRERLDHITIRPGTPSERITVEAVAGEHPLLRGLIWLHEASYWTVDGLNVTWDSDLDGPHDHMVKFTNGVGWTLEHSEIYGAHSFAAILVAGTRAGEPADWRIVDNVVHDTYPSNGVNQDHLIYVNSGLDSGPGLIEHNLLYGAANGEGIKIGGPRSRGGSANVTIRSNTIYKTAQNILIAGQSRDIVVDSNLLGKPDSNYGCIRGYRLTGSGNRAMRNRYLDAGSLILNDKGYAGVRDGGGNAALTDGRVVDRLRAIGNQKAGIPIGAEAIPASKN